jgi:YVTN family beta-propeller protein
MKLRRISGMSLLGAIVAASAVAQSLPALPPPPNASYGDFIGDITDTLNRDSRRMNFVPGDYVEVSFTLCVNGIVNWLRVSVTASTGGGVNVVPLSYDPGSWDCSKSHDFNLLELGNEDSLNAIENGLQDKPAPPPTPTNSSEPLEKSRAATSTLPRVLPPLADVPFLPVYPASRFPTQVTCSNSNPDVFMVNHTNSTVSRLNPCSGQLVATVFVFSNPLQVATTSDGSMALATSFDGALNFIDTSTNMATIVQTTNLSPSGVAISGDGTYAYVTSFDDVNNFLAKVDMTQQKVVQTLRMPLQFPQSVNFNPEGSQAYVMFPFDNSVVVVDTLTMTVTRTISVPGPAFGTVFNSTGTLAFIGTRTTPGTIQVINTASYQLVKSIPVGDNPVDLSIFGNDQLLFSGNFYGNSVSIIDIPTLQVLNTVPLSGSPRGLVRTQ